MSVSIAMVAAVLVSAVTGFQFYGYEKDDAGNEYKDVSYKTESFSVIERRYKSGGLGCLALATGERENMLDALIQVERELIDEQGFLSKCDVVVVSSEPEVGQQFLFSTVVNGRGMRRSCSLYPQTHQNSSEAMAIEALSKSVDWYSCEELPDDQVLSNIGVSADEFRGLLQEADNV